VTRFISDPSEETIRSFMREWVSLLAAGRVDDAYAWLYRSDGFTARNILEWIYQYSPKYRANPKRAAPPVINDPASVDPAGERFYIDQMEIPDENGNTYYGAQYWIPLDGVWSGMRASFDVVKVGEGQYGMELTDISVS